MQKEIIYKNKKLISEKEVNKEKFIDFIFKNKSILISLINIKKKEDNKEIYNLSILLYNKRKKEIMDYINLFKTEIIKIRKAKNKIKEFTNKIFINFMSKFITANLNSKPLIYRNKILIEKWLSEKGKLKEIKLIYKSSKDGIDTKNFYKKCEGIGPTLSIIKSEEGRIFGGFTFAQRNIKKGTLRLKDNNAFLFSLDTKKKYNVLKSEIAIGCYDFYTLVFGNNGDSCGLYLNTSGKGTENHKSKSYDVPSIYELSGKNEFKFTEFEVYHIKFDK